MTGLTATDLFCGAGGSSLGAERAGFTLAMAANHWHKAIETHQRHFPHAGHDLADISQADPRRYPRTDVLIASPECTHHSRARGAKSRKRQNPGEWDAPDPAAERSRATMWDVPRFAEQMRYEAMMVENVVEVTKWVGWRAWCTYIDDLGYDLHLVSQNAMHHGVPQSRDRLFMVAVRKGIKIDLEHEATAWCDDCEAFGPARQRWKNGRTVGRYRQQWVWSCNACGGTAEVPWRTALSIIDGALPCTRIGDRPKLGKAPLADSTRARIQAGMERHGWTPITTAGAGNVYETTPGNRARSVAEVLAFQTTTAQTALAFAVQTAHGGRLHDLADPHPTITARDDRLSLVVTMRGTSAHAIANSARPSTDPLGTVTAGGVHHALVMANNANNVPQPATNPISVVTTGNRHYLIVEYNGNGQTRTADQPLSTVTAADRHALVMRNNGPADSGWQCTPTVEPVSTLASIINQSLVQPAMTVDDCGFRMLEPYESAAAMALPTGYISRDDTKRDQSALAGNAVCPPHAEWIGRRIMDALAA